MEKKKKLVVVGDSAFAEIAYEYFTHDSPYEVVAFSVETPFLKKERLLGLPVVPLETLSQTHPSSSHEVYVAIVYTQLNQLRARLVAAVKSQGYSLASYISSHAFVWKNVTMGEHCFIFENNVIQPFVTVGNNVVMWSGNHIGHHSTIGDHCFISSHVVISGFVNVGQRCFLGVNATLINNISIEDDCWIGPQVLLTKSTTRGDFFRAPKFTPETRTAFDYLRVNRPE